MTSSYRSFLVLPVLVLAGMLAGCSDDDQAPFDSVDDTGTGLEEDVLFVDDITVSGVDVGGLTVLTRDQESIALGQAGYHGTLAPVGDCLGLLTDAGSRGEEPTAIVWPPGTVVEGDSIIIDGVELRDGAAIVSGGQPVDVDVIKASFDGRNPCGTEDYAVIDDISPAADQP